MEKEVRKIERKDTLDWLINIHYAKRMPSITYSFGLFYKNETFHEFSE